jgi:ATP phosphoribosyltransferase
MSSSSKSTRRLAGVLAEMSPQRVSAESFEAALLKLALPSGSLQDATVDLFERANFRIQFKSRDYFPDVDDPELGLISFRAQEVSRYVEAGVADCGITGRDWIVENGNAVRASPVHLQPDNRLRQPQCARTTAGPSASAGCSLRSVCSGHST